ncbi:large conductance mechanosensitive channel protein MscL [Tengunoibacter tsumagoiensis]|uniref:Large-conductance mechanosensitive channel n=1 Tax=Tengunoibacter tsumagoiensis TaxID=2014871 RepID=A0A401ZX63_9CHLR|nr:large conductance mechanosensitive channel protein MscL [Tengunoibacter tsumagoiensis]GCE11438.1 hypothetical protein KTT_12970 [Tengunoibacter tsumagoiensis]
MDGEKNPNFFDRDKLLGSVKEYGGRGLHAGFDTLGDFKKFLLRGNVVDLAVGVVIGAAFNGLVQAAVTDLLQPLIGSATHIGNLDTFHRGSFMIGHFLGVCISFLLTAAVVYFLVIKPINTLQDRYNRLRPKKPEAPTTRECPFCLSTVPLKATRCAYCTAQLPPVEVPSSQAVRGQRA